MRKRAFQIIIMLLGFALVYYLVDIIILRKEIIESTIKLIPITLLFISILLLLSSQLKHLYRINNIIGLGICFQAILFFFTPQLIPTIWNFSLALVVLLAGINLISTIKNNNLFYAISTGLAIIFLEFILLFKIEHAVIFSIAFGLLLVMTFASLLSVFSQK